MSAYDDTHLIAASLSKIAGTDKIKAYKDYYSTNCYALMKTFNGTGINIEDYHLILDELLEFDSTIIELNGNKFLQVSEKIKVLQEMDMLELLPKGICSQFKELSQKYSEVQSRIEELKLNELPRKVKHIKTFQEKGLISVALYSDSMEFSKQCIHVSMEREYILEQLEHIKDKVAKIGGNNNRNMKKLLNYDIKASKLDFGNRKE